MLKKVETQVTLDFGQALNQLIDGLLPLASAPTLQVEQTRMYHGAGRLFDETLVDESEVIAEGIELCFSNHGFWGI